MSINTLKNQAFDQASIYFASLDINTRVPQHPIMYYDDFISIYTYINNIIIIFYSSILLDPI